MYHKFFYALPKSMYSVWVVISGKIVNHIRTGSIYRRFYHAGTPIATGTVFGGKVNCAELTWTDLDLVNGRVKLPRRKTGISRDLPLWPETVEPLEKIPRTGKLVFYTSRGNPYIQTFIKSDGNGNRKYTTLNTITTKFSRLIKKSGFDAPKGTGFYSLRRTAATFAARSGDPFAVQRLLGHTDLQMATRYVQDVSQQTDRVIENSRKYVI
jgi:integrase